MPKPICIVRIPQKIYMQPSFNFGALADRFVAKLHDYHVFVLPIAGPTPEDTCFEVYHEKDLKEVDVAALNKEIENALSAFGKKKKAGLIVLPEKKQIIT